MASASLLRRLRPFSSCDASSPIPTTTPFRKRGEIGDALVKLKHPQGGFLDGLRMRSPLPGTAPAPRIMGPALTVKMVRADDDDAPRPPRHFADYNRPGAIMYVQQPGGMYSACWGGLMSTRAKYLGAEGVVVDGRVRDVGEHREMGFPVFSRDTSVLGSNTFTRASEIDVPLRFGSTGDLWVSPGDVLVGDEDGVVVVPPGMIEEVAELCAERAGVDAQTLEALRMGEAMGPTIARLRK